MAGLSAVAITDHGPLSGGQIRASFFLRFNGFGKGMRILRGIEANISPDGTDVPARLIPHCDLVLAGLHVGGTGPDIQQNTDDVIRVMETCHYVDVITHPHIRSFPLDFTRIVPEAVKHGVCLELNNSTLALGKGDPRVAEEMLAVCRRHGCQLLELNDFPAKLIMNRDLETTLAWVQARQPLKQEA